MLSQQDEVVQRLNQEQEQAEYRLVEQVLKPDTDLQELLSGQNPEELKHKVDIVHKAQEQDLQQEEQLLHRVERLL